MLLVLKRTAIMILFFLAPKTNVKADGEENIHNFFLIFLFLTKMQFATIKLVAVGNMSGNRCESDCRSRGRKFDPGSVPYFHGD